jgi:hypothetical protein
MKRFVCYTLRIAAACSEEEDESSEESEENREEDNEEEDPLHDAQELFLWHGDQKQLAVEMWQSLNAGEEGDGETQVLRMLTLLGSFIFQTAGDEPFCSPLIHFLAVLGIDEEMERLRRADNFSFMLAGVVYCVRVLGVEILLPSSQRKHQGEAEREHFLQQRQKFLTDGSYSSMSTMINLLAYSKYITLNKSNEGSIQWSADHRVLYFHGRPIVISRFRQMIQDAIAEAEQLLWQELMWTAEPGGRFSVPLDQMVDDMTFTMRGFSFVSRPSNGLGLNGGLDWMIKRMQQSSKGSRMRRGGSWKTKLVRQYLRVVDRFREALLFCIHVSGGQPARGTEITTIRHQNGFLQDRNVYVVDGRMVVITRYHKSQWQFDAPKIIPRFLPWQVGQLLAVYLGYVRPFAEQLTVQVRGGESGWSDHVWADAKGPWKTDRLTSVLTEETAQRLGERLTTWDYRHVAISIGRVFVGEQFARGYKEEIGEAGEEEEGEAEAEDLAGVSDPLELSAGRGEVMGAQRYGVPSNIVKHLSIRSMETFRQLSEGWHWFLGLSSIEQGKPNFFYFFFLFIYIYIYFMIEIHCHHMLHSVFQYRIRMILGFMRSL